MVQKMFADVDADVYVMVDGDGTYPASKVHELIAPVIMGDADMVVGSRLMQHSRSHFAAVNHFGNRLILWMINTIFGVTLTDILSGYRAFNREIVKNMPLVTGGFETETELTIKALARRYRILEIPVDLGARPKGSFSKIRILYDGWMILNTILALSRDYKPLTFFGIIGLIFIAIAFIPGTIVALEFVRTGILRLLSAILAVGLILLGFLSITAGLVIHTITRHFQELEQQLRLMGRSDALRFSVLDKQVSSDQTRCG